MDPITLLGLGGSAVSLIGGLLNNDKPQAYHDPYKNQRLANISDLMAGRQGQQIANVASAESGRMANLAFEGFKNDPNLAGNAAVRMGAYNSTQRAAQDSMVRAQVQGSQIDQQNKAEANNMLQQERQFDYLKCVEDQKAQSNPSFLEQMGQNILSSAAGSITGSIAQGFGMKVSKDLFGIDLQSKDTTTPGQQAQTPTTIPGTPAMDLTGAGQPMAGVTPDSILRALGLI